MESATGGTLVSVPIPWISRSIGVGIGARTSAWSTGSAWKRGGWSPGIGRSVLPEIGFPAPRPDREDGVGLSGFPIPVHLPKEVEAEGIGPLDHELLGQGELSGKLRDGFRLDPAVPASREGADEKKGGQRAGFPEAGIHDGSSFSGNTIRGRKTCHRIRKRLSSRRGRCPWIRALSVSLRQAYVFG